MTWTCGLHILLFLRLLLWLGRDRTTLYDRFFLRLAPVAMVYPGNNMVHRGSRGMVKEGETGEDALGWGNEWRGVNMRDGVGYKYKTRHGEETG